MHTKRKKLCNNLRSQKLDEKGVKKNKPSFHNNDKEVFGSKKMEVEGRNIILPVIQIAQVILAMKTE